MVFSSLIFIFVFLPLLIVSYYISPKFLKNFVLLLASLIFYAWGEPVYIVLMIFTTVVNYFSSILIDKYKEKKKIARVYLLISIAIDLGILGFFKYFAFLISIINTAFGLKFNIITLPLPVGISFYTFQTMSYVIDVYKEKVPVQKNIISFGTYITMFPQLIAGPIVKYSDIFKQLNKRTTSLNIFGQGVELFIIGLCKKVLIANNIGILWQSIKADSLELSVLSAWLGIIAFTFQIYFDFSGYSDMALGLGKMFGFDLPKNFNYPYTSKSITEFWRRWHITLGSWFREYVYIPLGGNRAGILKQLRNILIVWFLTGLWHGASWNFVFWGLYYGFILTMEKLFLLRLLDKRTALITHIYTLILVIVGWVFFDFQSMSLALGFIATMFGFGSHLLLDNQALYYLHSNGLLLILAAICSTPLIKNLLSSIKERGSGKIWNMLSPIVYLFFIFLCTAYLVNESYNPFLYFRF